MQTDREKAAPLGYRVTVAATMIGCTERTIYRHLRDKRLRAKRIAGVTLVTAESLADLVNGSPDWTPRSDPVAA